MSTRHLIMVAAQTAMSTQNSDPYFANVSLLLQGDGTHGAQNNTFVDSSPNNFAITRNGNTTQGTFSPFSKEEGKWGVSFDGTDDRFDIVHNANLNLSGGLYTVECWIYLNSGSGASCVFGKHSNYTANPPAGYSLWINNLVPSFGLNGS